MKARERMKRGDTQRAEAGSGPSSEPQWPEDRILDPETELEANAARRQEERERRYFIAAGKDGPAETIVSPVSSRPSELSPTSSSIPNDNDSNPAELSHTPTRERIGSADLTTAAGHVVSITHDRDSIGTNPYARTHWALGLLSVEEDIAKIDLGKGEA